MIDSHLITHIDYRCLEGPNKMLLAPCAWYSARYNVTGCAPIGFVYDEASVPRLPIAYWLFGGTGNEASLPHDMGYRWQYWLTRWQWDMIFFDIAKTRHGKMSKQTLPRRAWRVFARHAMTAGVIVGGWTAFNHRPGALDIRTCKKCIKPSCEGCNNFYPKWQDCLLKGYRPDIILKHGG